MNTKWQWALSAALSAVLTLGILPGAQATPVLYGVSLDGHNSGSPGASKLYTVNTTTGAGTLVGDIGSYAVNALAVDPTTGLLYGSTTSWSGAFNGLLRIDPVTGAATEIGPFGAFTSILGLTFDSTGRLFGWHDPGADDPVEINITTGAATTVGGSGIGTAGHVMAFDNSDNLTLVQGGSVYDISTATGVATFASALSFDPGAGGADFDPMTGLLWAARDNGRTFDSFIRITNIGANSFTDIDTDISYLNALTFGATAVPGPATLGLVGLGLLGLFGVRRRAA